MSVSIGCVSGGFDANTTRTRTRTRMAAVRSERVGGRAGRCMRRLEAGVAALVQGGGGEGEGKNRFWWVLRVGLGTGVIGGLMVFGVQGGGGWSVGFEGVWAGKWFV